MTKQLFIISSIIILTIIFGIDYKFIIMNIIWLVCDKYYIFASRKQHNYDQYFINQN